MTLEDQLQTDSFAVALQKLRRRIVERSRDNTIPEINRRELQYICDQVDDAAMQETERLEKERQEAINNSYIDPLTGAGNRRAYEREGLQALNKVKRNLKDSLKNPKSSREYLTLIRVDLDHFKETNDTFGHEMGNYVLQAYVAAVKESIRKEDMVFRFGGDEFDIVMVSNDNALPEHTKNIIDKINSNFLRYMSEKNLPVTASYGFACYDHDVTHIFNHMNKDTEILLKDLEKIADTRLYRAKKNRGSVVGTEYTVEIAA